MIARRGSRQLAIFTGKISGAAASAHALLALVLVASILSPDLSAAQTRYDSLLNEGVQSPFTLVADHVTPAVASISTSKTFRQGNQDNPLEDMFRQFFQRESDFTDREFDLPGAGSGFVVTPDGYVLTNNHVIDGAEEITVRLPGYEEEFEAEIVGLDPQTDLAVLKIKADHDLPSLKFGDSEDVRVGDWAIAIGNPLGQLDGSLTVGVISAKGRSRLNIQGGTPRYQDFIQTDAAINFGNSGGPLVNIHGQVVGVNTAINASGQNIGFAVPSNLVVKIYRQLRDNGRVVRGYLGVRMRELTPDLIDGRDLAVSRGVIIEDVVDGSPADAAGIEPGDIITEFNGEAITDDRDLQFKVADAPVGEAASVRVYRDGDSRMLRVVLDEYPEEIDLLALGDTRSDEDRWLGIAVTALDSRDPRVEDLREMLDITDSAGVLVVDVTNGSPADRARLRPGDVIVEIVDLSIENLEDFQAATERYRDRRKNIAILIRRGGLTSYITVDPRDDE